MPENSLLPISKLFLEGSPRASTTHLLILQHALRDTCEFIKLAQKAGYSISTFIAKPNSLDSEAVVAIGNLGVRVIEEPYSVIEESEILDQILISEVDLCKKHKKRLVIVDVGGYFCAPIKRADKEVINHVAGIVEVTTFGHNRYISDQVNLPLPVISLARSPLKDGEAHHVGETVVQATEDLLRDAGLILNGKVFGVIGYGMIGSRIANALQKRGPVSYTHLTLPTKA